MFASTSFRRARTKDLSPRRRLRSPQRTGVRLSVFTVTGVDDTLCDGDQPFDVRAANVASSDARFNGIAASPIFLQNLDNDCGDAGGRDASDASSGDASDTGSGDASDAGVGDAAEGGICTSLLTLQPQTINLVPDDNAVALGDFNGDTFLDAVIPGRFTNVVSLVLGNGNGTFKAPTTFPTGVNPTDIAVGDLNGDLKLDVVTPSTAGTVNVLLGNGGDAGTPFQTRVAYPTGAGAQDVTLALLDGDSNLDIVTSNYSANSVSVLVGNGDGTFRTNVEYRLRLLNACA